MFIQTENTPNPDSLKFVPDGNVVLESGTMDFPDARSSLSSPLAKSLFTVTGVQRVFFGNDFITVTKKPDVEWHEIKAQIFANIMDFYASGESVVSEQQDTSNTTILPTDSETVAMIKELLEVRIRPSVQEDGGDIEYKGFDEEAGVVYLKMVGSCSGCPSSSVTLKSGIERMLMHWIKEVTGVVAVESDDELDRLTKQEFAKLEKKLGEEGKGDDTAKESTVA